MRLPRGRGTVVAVVVSSLVLASAGITVALVTRGPAGAVAARPPGTPGSTGTVAPSPAGSGSPPGRATPSPRAASTASGNGSHSPASSARPGSAARSARVSGSSAPPQSSGSTCPAQDHFPTGYFAPQFGSSISHYFAGDQHISVRTGDPRFGSYLAVCYPPGSSASGGGAQAAMPIAAGPAARSTLTYWISFPVGFVWETAGKLPGLCGGGCDTGSDVPGSWSARLMWRAGGEGEVLLSNSNQLRGHFHLFADGRWHEVQETVVMNTPGVANGTLTVSIDGGVQVATETNAEFDQANDTAQVTGLLFSTFYGGGCSAPSPMETVDFADFSVSSA